MKPLLKNAETQFAEDEGGALTAFGLYVFLGAAVISAIGIDMAHLMSARSQLQVAADTAAHAALYYRNSHSAEDAKLKAIEVAASGMPESLYGELFTPEEVEFGDWDYTTQVFTVNPESRNAARILASRTHSKSNSVGSFLFQLVGMDSFDLASSAVFTTFRPSCFREGIFGMGVVDIQSNNGFSNGFCVHSNEHVELNSNNTFEPGTVVSMPDTNDVVLPRSGYETNSGLQAALRSGYYRPRILDQLVEGEDGVNGIFENFEQYPYGEVDDVTGDLLDIPDYITQSYTVALDNSVTTIDETILLPGFIYTMNCIGSGRVTISPSVPLTGFVFISDCEVKIANNTVLENVVIATRDTGYNSINTPSGLQVGRDDNCAEGGGAQLLTLGGMKFAAGLQLFGGQLVALGDVDFTANADGIEGASIVAGGVVDGESNMQMAFCGAGMERNFEADYFRLAL